MAYGVPIENEIVDFLPGMDLGLDHEGHDIEGYICDERGNWVPCRVSFSRWFPSAGRWENFGGYRDLDAGSFHYSICEHRISFPRSFQHEEMNFHPDMNIGDQLMHDGVVSRTRPNRIISIMDDHQSGYLENFHVVCRREGGLFLDFIIENSQYEPIDIPYDNWGLDDIRSGEALTAPDLQPCSKCVQIGGVSMRVEMHNVHGDYGAGQKVTSGQGSLVADMAPHQWLILSVGARRLAIHHSVIHRLKGYWFMGLLCFPRV
ncbi:uncharacterized protein METZ01_LOCUS170060 [marine metagenome]|uniref:Uncharacterized protein n=1 Tax=marine metagenome TaxID=408172 RepID=A0A382BTS7_9ZZZZ